MFLEKVIQSLVAHKVPYMLVGGYAVAFHGAVRGTVDIDIVIALNKRAFINIEKAMQSIGLESRLPVTAEEVFLYRENYIKERNLLAWSFVNPANPLEMVDVLITEDAKQLKSVKKQVNNMNINIIDVKDLIKLKKKSARKQDLEDICALEKLQ